MLPNYMQIPLLLPAWGATVKAWWLRESARWAPDSEELERLVTSRTRVIFVCNPNNPTGAVIPEQTMDAICMAAEHVGAWVVADEVYRGAEVEGPRTPSFWNRYARVVVTGGLSKAYGLPGLRIGWVVAPPEVIDTLWGYHAYTTIAPSVLSDRLAWFALAPAVHQRLASRTRQILTENLQYVRRWTEVHRAQVSCVLPRAGAIAFVRYHPPINSTTFAKRLHTEHSVLVVPGDHFQMDGYLRIGYGGQAQVLEEGLRRIGSLLALG